MNCKFIQLSYKKDYTSFFLDLIAKKEYNNTYKWKFVIKKSNKI
jgi:hypothetical protein